MWGAHVTRRACAATAVASAAAAAEAGRHRHCSHDPGGFRRAGRGHAGHARNALAAGVGGVVSSALPLSRSGPARWVLLDEPPKEAPPKATPPRPPAAAPRRPTSGNVNLDQEMLRARRLFLTGDINDESARVLIQQLILLEAEDPKAPVTIFINSGGGLVHSGFAIIDVMGQVSMPLKTVAYGRCLSIAALLLAAGTPGQRFAYEHARVMIHELSCTYAKQQTSDIVIKVGEQQYAQRVLEEILSAQTGKPRADIAQALSRDRYMSVAEAKEFGLIDHIVTRAAGVDGPRAKPAVDPAGAGGAAAGQPAPEAQEPADSPAGAQAGAGPR